jgi:hypothetical protein
MPAGGSDCGAPRDLVLTRCELAERSGIDQDNIRIERGSIFSDEKTLLSLTDNLGAE